MTTSGKVAVIIVSYRNPDEVAACLSALSKCDRAYPFEIFISENGGSAAYSGLVDLLRHGKNPHLGALKYNDSEDSIFNRVDGFLTADGNLPVSIGESKENLGYAGGINAWIRRLIDQDDWRGFWILNPDTFADPKALVELVHFAETHDKGMVGSRLLSHRRPEIILSRGLKWSFWEGRTLGVDNFTPASHRPDPEDVERRIDSPSGASFYITTQCVQRIGLMDERYFLYFEDFDWGMHAKAACGIGYAFDSVVSHIGGTTIGSASSRRTRSQLSVYLDYRNRLLFVRRNHPGWYPWTVAMVLARTLEFLASGAMKNFRTALAGWSAGVKGETGRPDRLLKQLAR
ncbi:glycosyltransferase [Rhodoblastus sp.]|uniref:glycosyltransferase n=1 Tax=Rhodoblastus sp. TaxID=1962975 RepID=UPI003F94BC81